MPATKVPQGVNGCFLWMRKTGLSPNEYPASTVLIMVFGIEFNVLVLQFHAFVISAVLNSCLFFRLLWSSCSAPPWGPPSALGTGCNGELLVILVLKVLLLHEPDGACIESRKEGALTSPGGLCLE
ncbi:hypothetical protein TIFTF001_021417 [Ficus carica]|uniref:Uncharacterized protein n=1 Tax=Ficus carica TaxID=3494 RepID=A0AA88DAQ9_FICCA|nr:hypothetical protein TIFTF001_021417 [Ficus carica]